MLKKILLSTSMSALLMGTAFAMPGGQAHHFSRTMLETDQSLVTNVNSHKFLKSLKKVIKSGPNSGRGLPRSAPNFKSVNAPSGRIPSGASSSSASSGFKAPSGARQAGGVPSRPFTDGPSWRSSGIKSQPSVLRTPAEKSSMLNNLNAGRQTKMYYTEGGSIRLLPAGNRVTFKPDGTFVVDRNNVRPPSGFESMQIDAVRNGDLRFNFRDSDNGVLRLENRSGQEVFMRSDHTFALKAGGGPAIVRPKVLKPNTPVASSRRLQPTDDGPSGGYDLAGQPATNYGQGGALPQTTYDVVPPTYDVVPSQVDSVPQGLARYEADSIPLDASNVARANFGRLPDGPPRYDSVSAPLNGSVSPSSRRLPAVPQGNAAAAAVPSQRIVRPLPDGPAPVAAAASSSNRNFGQLPVAPQRNAAAASSNRNFGRLPEQPAYSSSSDSVFGD